MLSPQVAMPRSNKPKRDDVPVKIDRAIWQRARVIAGERNLTIAEYLSEALRPIVDKDWTRTVKKFQSDISGEGHA